MHGTVSVCGNWISICWLVASWYPAAVVKKGRALKVDESECRPDLIRCGSAQTFIRLHECELDLISFNIQSTNIHFYLIVMTRLFSSEMISPAFFPSKLRPLVFRRPRVQKWFQTFFYFTIFYDRSEFLHNVMFNFRIAFSYIVQFTSSNILLYVNISQFQCNILNINENRFNTCKSTCLKISAEYTCILN